MRKDLLDHLVNYQHIYECVAVKKKTIQEIKDQCINEKGMTEPTIRRHFKMISEEKNRGMLLVDSGSVSINKPLVREVFSEIFRMLNVELDEVSGEVIDRKDAEIEELKKSIESAQMDNQKLIEDAGREQKRSKAKDVEIIRLNRKIASLVQEQISKQLDRGIVYAKEVTIEPGPTAQEALFLDESIVELDIDKSISKHGGSRESFYNISTDTENKKDVDGNKIPGRELTKENYFLRTARSIMPKSFLEKWANDVLEEKEFNEKHGITPIISAAKKKDRADANTGKSEIELHSEELIRKRKASIRTLLNDDRFTDQMKLQLYARFCDYHGTEMEQLINFAADYEINARWFIQILESSDVCDNYENIRDYLRIFAKPSEYKKKMDFARELVDGVWNIKMEYDGKQTLFALVPVEEIKEIRDRLLLPESKFICRDLKETVEEKKEQSSAIVNKENSECETDSEDNMNGVSAAVGFMIAKPAFVETYIMKDDDPDEAMEFGYDEDAIDYGDFEEVE